MSTTEQERRLDVAICAFFRSRTQYDVCVAPLIAGKRLTTATLLEMGICADDIKATAQFQADRHYGKTRDYFLQLLQEMSPLLAA